MNNQGRTPRQQRANEQIAETILDALIVLVCVTGAGWLVGKIIGVW